MTPSLKYYTLHVHVHLKFSFTYVHSTLAFPFVGILKLLWLLGAISEISGGTMRKWGGSLKIQEKKNAITNYQYWSELIVTTYFLQHTNSTSQKAIYRSEPWYMMPKHCFFRFGDQIRDETDELKNHIDEKLLAWDSLLQCFVKGKVDTQSRFYHFVPFPWEVRDLLLCIWYPIPWNKNG